MDGRRDARRRSASTVVACVLAATVVLGFLGYAVLRIATRQDTTDLALCDPALLQVYKTSGELFGSFCEFAAWGTLAVCLWCIWAGEVARVPPVTPFLFWLAPALGVALIVLLSGCFDANAPGSLLAAAENLLIPPLVPVLLCFLYRLLRPLVKGRKQLRR